MLSAPEIANGCLVLDKAERATSGDSSEASSAGPSSVALTASAGPMDSALERAGGDSDRGRAAAGSTSVGLGMTFADVLEMFELADKDGNGVVSPVFAQAVRA
jgi:hypothetical protein